MGYATHVFIAHVEKLVQLDTTVREGTEGPPLLELGGEGGVSDFSLETAYDEHNPDEHNDVAYHGECWRRRRDEFDDLDLGIGWDGAETELECPPNEEIVAGF